MGEADDPARNDESDTWLALLDVISAAVTMEPDRFAICLEGVGRLSQASRNRIVAYIYILVRAVVTQRLATTEPTMDQLWELTVEVRPIFWRLIAREADQLGEVLRRAFNHHDMSEPRFSAEVMTTQGAAAIAAIGREDLIQWVDNAHPALQSWYDATQP